MAVNLEVGSPNNTNDTHEKSSGIRDLWYCLDARKQHRPGPHRSRARHRSNLSPKSTSDPGQLFNGIRAATVPEFIEPYLPFDRTIGADHPEDKILFNEVL